MIVVSSLCCVVHKLSELVNNRGNITISRRRSFRGPPDYSTSHRRWLDFTFQCSGSCGFVRRPRVVVKMVRVIPCTLAVGLSGQIDSKRKCGIGVFAKSWTD